MFGSTIQTIIYERNVYKRIMYVLYKRITYYVQVNLHNFVHIYIKFMFSRYKFNDFKKYQM